METSYAAYKEEATPPLDSQEQLLTTILAYGPRSTALLDHRGVFPAITACGEQSPALPNCRGHSTISPKFRTRRW